MPQFLSMGSLLTLKFLASAISPLVMFSPTKFTLQINPVASHSVCYNSAALSSNQDEIINTCSTFTIKYFNSDGLFLYFLGNIPVERAKDVVCFLQWCGVSLVSSAIIHRVLFAAVWREPGVVCYHIKYSESDPLTFWKKEPLKGNSEVHLHTATKFGEDPSKDLGGDREQTNKRCSNYSMMIQPIPHS